MIVMSSIIQFHHHDDNGNIIFAVSALCHHENNDEEHEHSGILAGCCHCEHDEHNCGTGNECSAHLGDYQATKQTSITIDCHPTLLLFAILCESNIKGIFPCGEGAGYAGGITSSMMDGLKVSEAIAQIYNNKEE